MLSITLKSQFLILNYIVLNISPHFFFIFVIITPVN